MLVLGLCVACFQVSRLFWRLKIEIEVAYLELLVCLQVMLFLFESVENEESMGSFLKHW